jgi:hypothetical protein
MEPLERVTIYTTPYLQKALDLERMEVKTVVRPVLEMGRSFIEEGAESDICLMPYVSTYQKVLTIFRSHRNIGPVVFVADTAVDPEVMNDMRRRGAIFIDFRYVKTDFIRSLLMYLAENREQEAVDEAADSGAASGKPVASVKMTVSAVKRLQAALEEISDIPEVLSIEEIMSYKEFRNADFSVGIEVPLPAEGRKMPLFCITRLVAIERRDQPRPHHVLFCGSFYPNFGERYVAELAAETTPKRLETGLTAEKGIRPENAVQFGYKMHRVERTCTMLPLAEEDGRIGFVPITDFHLQKRNFIRIPPSRKNPLKVLVSSDQYATREVEVIDVSENGISFWNPELLAINGEVNVFMHWRGVEIVCRGVTRFVSIEERSRGRRIGVEIYPHENESERIGQYVFNCQLEIFQSLREGK